MANDFSLDLAIAPDGARQLIAAAINRPKKRAFGVLKTENEYVGFVRDDVFEIWERQGRAIHMLGTIRGRRGGSRVEIRLVLPRIRKILVGVFFALYALAAAGIAGNGGPGETYGVPGVMMCGVTVMMSSLRERSGGDSRPPDTRNAPVTWSG